uniref:HNH nuclease domain-containing protein n=1 Tax=viral metagenome TaxID=1070528 RepID=A0A6C0H0M9_9ZZZZ
MKYWTANQGKTYKEEITGGFLWAPKTNKAKQTSQFYTNVTLIKKDDIIFSLTNYGSGLCINAVGKCIIEFYNCENPLNHNKGEWINDGWRIDVKWEILETKPHIKQYFDRIESLLPIKYSPILKNGNAPQHCYVSAISDNLGNLFKELIGSQYNFEELIEQNIINEIENRTDITITEKEQIIKSRIGQGIFRKNVLIKEPKCRISNISKLELLIASHIKPWKKSNNHERLDGNNGLMLNPTVDKLFDKGFISFTDDGIILISNITEEELNSLGIDITKNIGSFSKEQCIYLDYHRKNILKKEEIEKEFLNLIEDN